MSHIAPEIEELRINIERLRTLLETLVVRGLRACGPDELAELRSYADHLDQTGAGHVAGLLNDLRDKIEKDDRSSARALLIAQTSVRVLDRLLTLRLVKLQYESAIAAAEAGAAAGEVESDDDE